MKTPLLSTFFLALLCAALARAQDANPTPERLQQLLRQYPDADTNKDGMLSRQEARAYASKLRAKEPASEAPAIAFAPTHADVRYGPHDRNVLDFWQAKSDRPAPVVVFIHGGGFVSGDKSKAGGEKTIQPYLNAGVSFAAINYRYRTSAPIQDVLRDCARAIQFIRSKSAEWNVDRARLASYGGSAGAGTSLWLAFHDDLADPKNPDPVLRESTRLVCAGSTSGQVSYDVLRWTEVLGEEATRKFGDGAAAPGFYGLATEEELRGPVGQKLRADCDMLGLISKGDAPVFLAAAQPGGPITDRGHYLHHPKHSQAIYDRCREIGVLAIADLPGLNIKPPPGGPANMREFILQQLQVKKPAGGKTTAAGR